MMMTKVIERLGKIETGRNSFDMNRLSLKQEVSEAVLQNTSRRKTGMLPTPILLSLRSCSITSRKKIVSVLSME